jgi:DNA-binding NarL/FixJ family response regulator
VYAASARLHLSQGRHDEARHDVAAARMLVDTLSTHVPDPEARAGYLAHVATVLPPLRATTQDKADHGLTAREREIATAIANGSSNREIADALVLSERTVESHVSHILAKLGFRSRTQIAGWVIENGWLHKPVS